MTPDAKSYLATTIRSARTYLVGSPSQDQDLGALHAATESAYRLSVRARDAGLDESARVRRGRLEAWIAEQLRAQSAGKTKGKGARSAQDFRREAEKEAAYTLVNRLVFLRLLEASGLRSLPVVTGGWESRAYKDFRELAPGLVRGDETEGYAFLLRLVFEELATDLPGLYGPAGVADLVPVPAAVLRHVVEALDDSRLESCWTDDMTLGWVYQYWNDPEREALDDKLNGGGKVEPHEIASKTQMFTERYMVDWLLQNSLGPMWLAICKKHGWTPEVERDGTLAALEARRADWRAKRAAGEVELTDLMPLYTDAERRWAYFVPQPIPDDAVDKAPDSIRNLKVIDPAVGSGHFLVVALGLLVALYREEARQRGLAGDPAWSDQAIVECILAYNLHGVDLDPRAVQIAAAALWLKAQQVAPGAHPERLNLVASNLRLASLPDDDPALVELRREVERDTGISGVLTDTLISALKGADHLGSLLKVDKVVEEAVDRHEAELGRAKPMQGTLFAETRREPERVPIDREEAKVTLLDRLEGFLNQHTSGDDLGLRLRGEQLASGVRFVRMVREGTYDLVVANPPYQGTAKMAESAYIEKAYPLGKADLYAAFLLRGLELVRDGGVSAMLTMRNWMFIKTYAELREHLFSTNDLRMLCDVDKGGFEAMETSQLISVVMPILRKSSPLASPAVALQLLPPGAKYWDRDRTQQRRAATLFHEGRRTFDPAALKVVPEWPLVYWWDAEMLRSYKSAPLIGDVAPATFGATTGNNTRFVRRAWEVVGEPGSTRAALRWAPFVNGAKGRAWNEDLNEVMAWRCKGLAYRAFCDVSAGANFRSPSKHFRRGVAFSMIGANFSARVHRYPSIFGNKGSSVFPEDLAAAVCAMNSARARNILTSLNPGIGFEVGDVNRLPLFPIANADAIFAQVESAFSLHESHREPSVEFRRPGPSPWRHAQAWAQTAVDRPEGAPVPEYLEQLDPEPPTDHLSFALGVALGRFGPAGSNREGLLDPATADLSHALPHGLLFLDRTLEPSDLDDSLGQPAAAPLHTAWAEHAAAISPKRTLRDWLAVDFFKDVHRQMYENRPIHWPLSSSNKTFVAWVNIHRMNEQTLRVLLADHLLEPTLKRLDGELTDLRVARDGTDKKAAREAERRLDRVMKAREELLTFIAAVEQCADRGAPPPDPRCPAREQDARYAPDLDDGVMINSAAMWPLLDPQWKDPRKWWKELATANGRKDYDWSRVATRYWPSRVDKKCQSDPSLGVAHGCFWRYHAARAWAWELRLQDEIGPDFRIEEPVYRPGGRDLGDQGDASHREAFLRDHPDLALAAIEKEAIRRMGRGTDRKLVPEMRILETGLWSNHTPELWELELRLAEKQGAELRILAPDEPAARAVFRGAHPEAVKARESFLANLAPPAVLFEEDSEDEDADAIDRGEDAEGDEESEA